MCHQMLAPLTRRTNRRKCLCGVGSRAERGLFTRTGSNACSRCFPKATARSGRPFLRIPRTRLGASLSTCACERTSWNRACRLWKRCPPKDGAGPSSSSHIVSNSPTNSPKTHKLSLAFDALVLSEAVGREVSLGKIMHGDGHATLKVKLSSLASEVRKRIKDITALLADNSPPDLVLNRHCGQCEFQARCRKQATEKDELSLLSGMSEKERKKLHGKGIFTVTQLSYTFRPRRRRRELRGKQEKFHHSLRALAIRENKIHAVDLLDPKLDGTPVYLDVEGLPDRDFYYLIGIRVGTGDGAVQYGFWADDEDGEKRIWSEFLDVLSAIPDPRLIHFGSYETVFLKRMRERHGGPRESSAAETAIEHAVNLAFVRFRAYLFPDVLQRIEGDCWISRFSVVGLASVRARSDRLAASLGGFKGPCAIKQALLDYNREDCEALELVANRLVDLHRAGTRRRPVVAERCGPRGRDEAGKPVPASDAIEFALAGNGDSSTRPPIGIISASGST